MTTQHYTATSLDGYFATEDSSLECLVSPGNVSDTSDPTFITEAGALVMGSSTRESMLREAQTVCGQPLRRLATRHM